MILVWPKTFSAQVGCIPELAGQNGCDSRWPVDCSAALQASIICWHFCTETSIGFSHKTCLPALAALIVMLGMERVGRHDIDHVNVRVVRHVFHVFVVIDVLVRNVVLRLPFLRLSGMAGDDAGQPAILGLGDGGRKLRGGQAAQAAQGKPQLAVRIFRPRVAANLVIHGALAVAKAVALRKRRRLVKMPFMRPRLQHGKCQRKSVPRPPALDMNSLKDHQFVIYPTYNPESGAVSIIENQAVSRSLCRVKGLMLDAGWLYFRGI